MQFIFIDIIHFLYGLCLCKQGRQRQEHKIATQLGTRNNCPMFEPTVRGRNCFNHQPYRAV